MYFNIGSAMGAGGSSTDTVTGAIIPLEGASSDWASEGYSSDGVSRLTPIPLIQNSLTFSSMLGRSTPLPGGAGSFGADVTSPSLQTFGTFLDEIQVDFLLEATQAHQSSRSLAAPRITLSNGNQAYIEVVDEQAYVSDLEPIVAENAVGFEYTVETVESGTKLTVRGTVSADRRYVTLDIKPEVIQLLDLENFPVISAEAPENVGFLQLPEISKKTLQTIVSVPDGGTLLLGGLRLTGELEREKGVPLLSKVPYINRFFDNRGMLRDEQTLLILVKPEILIQREEEEDWYPE
jgi:general secretion pathway protein D